MGAMPDKIKVKKYESRIQVKFKGSGQACPFTILDIPDEFGQICAFTVAKPVNLVIFSSLMEFAITV